jgi:hypothetical protein
MHSIAEETDVTVQQAGDLHCYSPYVHSTRTLEPAKPYSAVAHNSDV